ncbi:hypothetical protein [Yoonia sp.]|uniref:hypothetical protein n=1 Tax=Yoonia sp. TaxID=2212373 RepID=UPI0019FBB767|nr:hypothetical protein [Yoonia sp.]MBE0412425.1 hypothetical protein [Yoonia sp.]
MRSFLLGCLFLLGALTNAVLAQTVPDPVAVAEENGICAPFGVASASLAADGTVQAVCNTDATAFVPLLGALGPALTAGAAVAVAAAVSGGNATPDTQ